MRIGMVGLGRMGNAIAHRLLQAGHTVFGFDPSAQALAQAKEMGVEPVDALKKLPDHVRVIWIMVPAGKPVDEVISQLQPALQKGDILIDGGNSNFADSVRRAEKLNKDGITLLDCGTSGGLLGKDIGFALMVGGDRASFDQVHDIFTAVAAPDSVTYCGPSGAGHYVKMVHNGIEYGLLQAYAEGFHLLKQGHYKELDLAAITKGWQKAAVVRSWILDLAHTVFAKDQELTGIGGQIAESGMGRWTVGEAQAQNIPVRVIKEALAIRAWSRETGGNYGTKLVAMLRNQFGGHQVEKK